MSGSCMCHVLSEISNVSCYQLSAQFEFYLTTAEAEKVFANLVKATS